MSFKHIKCRQLLFTSWILSLTFNTLYPLLLSPTRTPYSLHLTLISRARVWFLLIILIQLNSIKFSSHSWGLSQYTEFTQCKDYFQGASNQSSAGDTHVKQEMSWLKCVWIRGSEAEAVSEATELWLNQEVSLVVELNNHSTFFPGYLEI